jgi:hypothetical protein
MPGVVEIVTRKSQTEMDPKELRQWFLDRRQQLTRHKRFTRRYLHRRARPQRSQQTCTDRQYQVPGSVQRSARIAGWGDRER